jgi:hypothetical protein
MENVLTPQTALEIVLLFATGWITFLWIGARKTLHNRGHG